MAKIEKTFIAQLDQETRKTLNVYISIAEAVKELGINDSNISRCANGRRDTAQGFKWRWIDANEYNELIGKLYPIPEKQSMLTLDLENLSEMVVKIYDMLPAQYREEIKDHINNN